MNVISLGMGVQSVAMYYMSSIGVLPRADYAIMADTGKERSTTYQYLEKLQGWQRQHHGIPIMVARQRNLYQDLMARTNSDGRRFASIPAFTLNSDGTVGMLRRQCTGEYKVQVIDGCIRELYNLPKGARRPTTEVWMGITTDEIERMSAPTSAWKTNVYPFVGYQFHRGGWKRMNWGLHMSRADIVAWYVQQGLPVPDKSACVFCPYQSDGAWARLKRVAPQDFEAAVAVDNAIRNSSGATVRSPCYLHRCLTPLGQLHLDGSNYLWESECSGSCHL
jgi:hypothetical protein